MVRCFIFFITHLLSCGGDVMINKLPNTDTSTSPIVDSGLIVSPTEPASEPSVEPTEGVGGYVHYYLRQVACPACMGETQEITVEFNARFHESVNESYTTWVIPQGQCTESLSYTMPTVTLIDFGPEIKIRTDSGLSYIQAYKNALGVYSNSWNTDSNYERDTVHYIKRDDTEFTSFTSFHGFESIEPYELRYIDPSYAFAAPIYRSGTTFWWSPYGSNTTFMITLAIYSQNGSTLLGYVACSGGDTGMMTIPGQYLSNYPYGALVAVHMTRHKIELVLWEEQNTFLETHMEWEVVGTGHIE